MTAADQSTPGQHSIAGCSVAMVLPRLVALGREMYAWLDGETRWLERLPADAVPPLVLEFQARRGQTRWRRPAGAMGATCQCAWLSRW